VSTLVRLTLLVVLTIPGTGAERGAQRTAAVAVAGPGPAARVHHVRVGAAASVPPPGAAGTRPTGAHLASHPPSPALLFRHWDAEAVR
jgi:hypothetical protein